MRSIFGWSYPPGCSGPPDEPEYEQPRCTCGAYLSFKADRVEPWESSSQCDGKEGCDNPLPHAPHKIIWDAGATQIVICKKCKKENKL